MPSFQKFDTFRQPLLSRFGKDTVIRCSARLTDIPGAEDRNHVAGSQIVFVIMIAAIIAKAIAVHRRIIFEPSDNRTFLFLTSRSRGGNCDRSWRPERAEADRREDECTQKPPKNNSPRFHFCSLRG